MSFINFWIIPLIFCLVITLCNLKEFNSEITFKFFIASYISFIIGILVYSFIGNLFELVLEKKFQIRHWGIVDISYLVAVGIISPLLFFYINSLMIKKINFYNNLRKILIGVIIISLALIIIYSYDIHSDFGFKIWQFVVAFILQFIILNDFDNTSEMENLKT
ncbi:hypothetical protein CW732_00670 [Olleya sp. Bg11-27]|nr:hypothetical protein CW732_00670 [Olleya sp. Bg11-27]